MEVLKKIAIKFNQCKLLVFALIGITITPYKLYISLQIHGYLPGAKIVVQTAQDKWHESLPQNDIYWISFDKEKSIKSPGQHRTNLNKKTWNSIRIGDGIEMIAVHGSNDLYAKNGIYASWGNFIIDIVFFAMTYLCFLPLALFLTIRRKRKQKKNSSYYSN